MFSFDSMPQENRFRVRKDGEIIGDVMLVGEELKYSLVQRDIQWEMVDSLLELTGKEEFYLDGISINRKLWEKNTVFYLVRHASTWINEEYRLQGWYDPPLTEGGIREAEKTGKALKDIEFVKAASSDLERAYKTMEIALEGRNIPMERREMLREINFGVFDKYRVVDVMPDEYFNPVGYRFCGGENYNEVSFRVLTELRYQSYISGKGNVFIASSSAALYQTLCRIDSDKFPQGKVPWKAIPNGAFVKVGYSRGKFTVLQGKYNG